MKMSRNDFPHPLDFLPRPGMREIRVRAVPPLPRIRNERKEEHGTE